MTRLVVILALLQGSVYAQRTVTKIDSNWQFVKGESAAGSADWQEIHLPHTWNTDDVMDDVPGYYRGVGWYRKVFTAGNQLKGKTLSLYFEGANQEAEVFINGKKAGEHIGGYTGFSIDITPYVKFNSANEILVKVDNSFNRNIAPLSADFTFYGGIYRDVYLVTANKIHFRNEHGSDGVYITTPQVSEQNASVEIKSIVTNTTGQSATVYIVSSVSSRNGQSVAQSRTAVTLPAHISSSVLQKMDAINSPRLWSPEDPYLYIAETKITDATGRVLDVITNPVGFRWFSFDADKGFLLNGAPYKLVGASRHQDYKGMGNAVPDELAIHDVVLLKNMGANFLRVAHYPQDPSVLQACDSLGLLASVEIPVVNEITETDSFYRNCEQMQVEMIRQNFNHPSVVVWCYMNEVLLRPHFTDDKERQKEYFASIKKLAQSLEDLTRREDPSRYTMMANHGNLGQYKSTGLL
ncbi:MAG TPA: glycoside hydrolase family 2 TIM barrel-domain containing protein, partial [Chitinophagaceae bacterium]|nr:glycoside hydrolase family 2 TIM barrel-domain containing protein [Chitinophagaceae bacterium]